MPAKEFQGKFDDKVVYQKRVFQKYWKELLLKNKKNYCQLCINYESNKYILKIFLKTKVLVIPVAIESLLYLTPSQAIGKFMYLLKH